MFRRRLPIPPTLTPEPLLSACARTAARPAGCRGRGPHRRVAARRRIRASGRQRRGRRQGADPARARGRLRLAHYAELLPHYTGCKVLGRTASGARDVYMEVEALHGVVKMWAEIEVPKPVVGANGVETIATRYIKGNVKVFDATWRLRKIDDASTELSLEVFLDPGLPLPVGLANRENLTGSTRGVVAMRGHAEQPKK